MAKIVRLYETGGPEVLRLEDTAVGAPGPGQVRLRHLAAGLNFADTYFRNGTYPVALPTGLGAEAAGVVEEVGEGVSHVAAGDLVTYTGFINTLGAYSTERLIPAEPLIKLPKGVAPEVAAASTMRGLTAAYLLRSLYPFRAGETILLHAAAGGLGLILSQWARLLGLRVIGLVSSEAKAEVARSFGTDEVLISGRGEIAPRVRELTGGEGVSVVFDGVGHDTFAASLDSLKRRGLMVCVGTASGVIPPFDPQILARKGSLFLTRPALADYISTHEERTALAGELFGHIAAGRIKVRIDRRYELADAGQAHRDLEARKLVGSAIFVMPPV
jgi:NADPH:quinone reductase